MIRKFILIFIFIGLMSFCAQNVWAGSKLINKSVGKAAIKKADPVAYFEEKKYIKGSKEFIYEWMDAKWYFSSEENKKLFEEEPEKYAPQYGGYCAFAIAQGATAPIDPKAWSIVSGKLYLNYNVTVKEKWEKNKEYLIQQADIYWTEKLYPHLK